jgi:TonB-linked SusC/RagA family outer membrane protein
MKTKFNGILTLLLAFMVQFTFAQERVISGVVEDDMGPVADISVVVKGTTKGTVTDFDGKYSIKAKKGDALVFSHISYGTVEKVVGDSDVINVKMSETGELLKEVVISAVGRKFEPKKSTVAIQSVNGEDFQKAREANIVNSLSGRIAGVQVTSSSGTVGSSSRLVLRGATSLTGNNQPLFVIDGVPIDNRNRGTSGPFGGTDAPTGVSDINPDDVESITVLKGPSAAALYGVRASNGVIVIKTKKGKTNKTLGISFNTTITMDKPMLLPSFQNSYGQGGSPDYFEWINGSDGDGGIDESWGPPLDVGLEFVQWFTYPDLHPEPWVSHPNNVKDFFDTGVTINNSVSISGGSENTSFRMSVGNMDQKGMIPFTEFKRFTVGLNGSNIKGIVTTTGSVNFTKSESDNMPTVGYDNENPVQQMYWSARNVDWNMLRDWRSLPLSPAGTPAEGTPLNWNTLYQNNPFWVLETNRATYDKNRVVGAAGVTVAISDAFKVNANVGADVFSIHQTKRKAWGTNSDPFGFYYERDTKRSEINASLLASYTKSLSDDLHLDLSVGGNKMISNFNFNYQDAPQLEIPGLYTVDNLRTGQIATSVSTRSVSKINSVYGVAKLGYKDYLFIEFTGRNDWASVLPKNNNSFFYPSISASFVLSEMFDVSNTSLNFLKLRGGWAEVGGFGPLRPYQTSNTFGLSTDYGVTLAFLPGTLNNPEIKPEKTTGIEFGIDSRFFNNKLRFNLTYYDQTSKDLIARARISGASGFTHAFKNVGEMNNKGIEIQLGTKVYDKNDLSIQLDFNYAKNKNTVVSLGDLESLVLGGQWGLTVEAREGEAYGSLVGSYFLRNDDGKIIYVNGLPQIAPGGAKKVLGNVTPDWTGGVNLGIKYKNFNFSTLVDAKIGGDIHSMSTTWGRYAGVLEETLIGRETGIVGDGVMNVGTEANPIWEANNVIVGAEDFNKASYSNSIHESSIFDASYVKLRQIQIGYDLPKKLISKTGLNTLSISIVGRNLGILYKNAPHIDPETGFDDSNGNQGLEFGQQPTARSIGVNLNFKF